MGKWVHRIIDGQCAHCGPVTLVARPYKGGQLLKCPNSSSVTNKGRSEATKRRDALGPYDGRCESCGDECTSPHADHDHSTGLVRGYLCPPCNLGIGLFHDDPERMRKAIKYLAAHGG